MQDLRWLVLCLALCSSGDAAEVVRLVTWNLEWFPGRKPAASQRERDEHFLEVASILPQLRADILVLQEVRDDDTAQQLARLIPGFSVHVTSRFKDPLTQTLAQQQICILSRFKAEAAWSETWKRGWANAPRGYAYARLQVGDVPLHVYGLHLKSNLGKAEENTSKREDAIEQLIGHVNNHTLAAEAVIVAGDFNTSKEQVNLAGDLTLIKLEKAGFFWTFEGIAPEVRVTVPRKGSYPPACFDHIYTRSLGRPVARVLSDIQGSDHLPVAMEIFLGGK